MGAGTGPFSAANTSWMSSVRQAICGMLQIQIFLREHVSPDHIHFPNYIHLNPHSAQLQENPFFHPRTSGKPQEFLRFFIISHDCQVSHHLAWDRHAICPVRGLHWLFCELLPAILRASLWLLPPFPLPQSPHIVTFHQPFLKLQEPGQCTHIP